MGKLLGIDTGGTYTDAVIFDEAEGVEASAKSLTTKHDLVIGVRGALEGVLAKSTAVVPARDIRLVSLSTTLATNAIVEGHGAPVCLILIGFSPESLERGGLGQALGSDPVVFINGGHDPMGEEQAPLDLEAARQAITDQAEKVAAFAVAGYFGVRNPAHERRVRDLVHELSGLPVTCSHELTSNLDAPRRALTAVLNARLIPQLQSLILAVRGLMDERDISCPLMVVKGDGSLITDEVALTCPVETILSGPAASVVGARFLSGEADVLVSDIGGTTTDIALLSDGLPLLNRDGARVAGWRTMVEAVAVYTCGLGGDSEIRLAEERWPRGPGLLAGPRRVQPLSLLIHEHPHLLSILEEQLASEHPSELDGRFGLRLRPLDGSPLTRTEDRLWQALEDGPVALEQLLASPAMARPFARLLDRGLVIVSAFAPSDAAHVLGRHDDWSFEAAVLGARLLARRGLAEGRLPNLSPEALADYTIERVVVQSGEAVIASALGEEGEAALEAVGETKVGVGRGAPARRFVERALAQNSRVSAPLLSMKVQLDRPLVAIGAPAATYYPAVAARLGTRLSVPPFAEVSNAVGAVAGGVMQTVSCLVTSPEEGRYRVHLPQGLKDFTSLEPAADFAESQARDEAVRLAKEAGADEIELKVKREKRSAELAGGGVVFVDLEVTATAVGRPRLG
ncbi:MAG: hydantoinase/oxoprolinase family protein [Pseudomonadota bacterium]